MTGAIYVRVSSPEQAEDKTSLDSQEKECKKYAREHHVDVPDQNVFIEKGESAKFIDRPELQNLLRFVRENRGELEYLFIWKIDRLARNLGDYYGIKVALAKYGVKIVSTTEPIDDDPVGRFLEAILAAAAQFDNEIRATRSVMGLKYRVEQGGWPHTVPIGYKRVGKRLVKDEEWGDIIADILKEFSKGIYTLTDISEYAMKKGVKTKFDNPKGTDQMKAMLQNLIYAGFTKSKLTEKITKGLHDRLVDEEIIQKNIDIITGSTKDYTLRGDDIYPLRGTILCSNCKQLLRASAPKGNGGYYNSYACGRKTCTKAITGKRVSRDADTVHKEFREALEGLKPLTRVAKLHKEILLRSWNFEYGNAIENAKRINREIERYRDLRLKTNTKFIEDKITEDDKIAQISKFDEELKQLNKERVDADHYVAEKEKIVDDGMNFITEPDLFWNHANTQVRQAIQKLLFPNGLVYDFETSFGTIDLNENYLLIHDIATKKLENPGQA
jgi:DNA invertase Pin-like site-specific DNA recombinase